MIILLRDPYRSFLVLSDTPVLFIEVYSYDGFQDTLHTDMITHWSKKKIIFVKHGDRRFRTRLSLSKAASRRLDCPEIMKIKFLVRRRRAFLLTSSLFITTKLPSAWSLYMNFSMTTQPLNIIWRLSWPPIRKRYSVVEPSFELEVALHCTFRTSKVSKIMSKRREGPIEA